jgi:hypothetical protein
MGVQRIDSISIIPNVDLSAKPGKVIAQDAISKSMPSAKVHIPSKPTLPDASAPIEANQFYVWRLLRLVEKTEKAQCDHLDLTTMQQEELLARLGALHREELEKAHQSAKAGEQVASWNYASQIATALFATATICVGWYLTGCPDVSAWTSYGMVAAGTGSIASMSLSQLDILPQFNSLLALACGTLGLVLGGGGSFALVSSQLPKLLSQTSIYAINALYGISAVGRSYRKAQMDWYAYGEFDAHCKLKHTDQKTQNNAFHAENIVKQIAYTEGSACNSLREYEQQIRQMNQISKAV